MFSTWTQGRKALSYQPKGLPLKYGVLHNRPEGSSKEDLMVIREPAVDVNFYLHKAHHSCSLGPSWESLTHRLPLPKQDTHCPARYKEAKPVSFFFNTDFRGKIIIYWGSKNISITEQYQNRSVFTIRL